MQTLSLGASLIEVIISLFIISTTLMAIEVNEFYVAQASHSYLYQTIARNQVYYFIQRIQGKSNDDDSLIEKWNTLNADLLPQGIGRVEWEGNHRVLTLAWGGETCQTNYSREKCLRVILS